MWLSWRVGVVALHAVETFQKGGCHLMQFLLKRRYRVIVFFLFGGVWDRDLFNIIH